MSKTRQSAVASRSIHVLAGVMRDREERVLVAQRPPGKSMAGAWEFPGGKLEDGESRLDGLAREFREELGIELGAARPLIRYRHHYPDLAVDLDAWLVEQWTGEPHGREGQAVAWHHLDALSALGLLPADEAVLQSLRLPSLCGVSPGVGGDRAAFLDAVEIVAAREQSQLLVLRCPALSTDELLELAAGAACRMEGSLVRLELHGDPWILGPQVDSPSAHLAPRLRDAMAGLHIPGRFLDSLHARPVGPGSWFGVSCHDRDQLTKALAVGADYAFLGPVKATTSHPGQDGMGWEKFEYLVRELPLPVYAIGGLGPEDLSDAWAHGAQGIAAIRSLWPG